MNPRRPLPQQDILPSLFAQQTQGDPRNFAFSVLLHFCVALIIGMALHRAVSDRALMPPSLFTPVPLSDAVSFPASHPGTGGANTGGSRHDNMLASLGVPPPAVAHPLMTPTTHVPDEPPALVLPQTTSNSIPIVLRGIIGDPNGVRGPASDGPGKGRGIGDGPGDGIGKGTDAGWAPMSPGGGVSMPQVIYDPEPDYTEEARRMKHQGNVLLACVVGTDGRVHDARVQRALGLGLDEKAIEAVRKWKFVPSSYNGKPVAVKIMVEVNFRMY